MQIRRRMYGGPEGTKEKKKTKIKKRKNKLNNENTNK